ncbi:MAG: endonuclease III [Epulopiscium sp. Nele67-Bin004]|nr:MAG: endonuclease III [Epulopiscium sp. Nele67-Bin004]
MKQHVKVILQILDDNYPKDVPCFLNHETTFQLLVATILSAQCTDDRVNIVTKTLFEKYPTAVHFANANILELEEDVRSTGFYKNKAKNIMTCANQIVNDFGGEVPADIDKLVTLAGVGRKTANVILGNIFKIPSVVVDTHVKRISIRWGFTPNTDPVAIEKDLMDIIPKEHWIRYNTQVILHGRAICTARAPKCINCMFLAHCPYGLINRTDKMPDIVKEYVKIGHMY